LKTLSIKANISGKLSFSLYVGNITLYFICIKKSKRGLDYFARFQKYMANEYCQKIVSDLEKDPVLRKLFDSIKSNVTMSCQTCSGEGKERNLKAYLTNLNKIVLCTNKLKVKDDYKTALIHEAIHAYDLENMKSQFLTCDGLAYSELRAAREADCNQHFPFKWMKDNCIRQHASKCTEIMYPGKGSECVQRAFDSAMMDLKPFD
jgi:hypothetical protein